MVNTCQISVVKNITSEKKSSRGTARTSTESEAPSWAKNRRPVHRTSETTPNPITRYTSTSSAAFTSIVLNPNSHCPLKTIGSRPGRTTNAASSGRSTREGTERNGRPRATFSAPNADTNRIAAPPSANSRFTHADASRSIAFTTSSTNTSDRNGIARVNTSSAAEKSRIRFGSPSRRNPRSSSAMRAASSLTRGIEPRTAAVSRRRWRLPLRGR